MTVLADATATIAAWAATIVVLLLVGAVFWSFLRRKGTLEGLQSPADLPPGANIPVAETIPEGDVPPAVLTASDDPAADADRSTPADPAADAATAVADAGTAVADDPADEARRADEG